MHAFAVFLFLHFWGAAEQHWYEARVAALKARGLPVRCEDLDAPVCPDAENAAPLLAEATRIARDRQRGSYTRTWGMEDASDEEREAALAYLDTMGAYFDLVARAARRPRCHVARDWKKWPDVGFDEIAWLQTATEHLACRAELDRREHGRTRRAAEAAVLMIDLGERCRIPGILGHLVTWTVTVHYPVRLLRTASRQPGFDAAEFRRIAGKRLVPPSAAAVHAALAEERATAIRVVAIIAAGGNTPFDEYLPLRGVLQKASTLRPFLYRDGRRMLDLMEEATLAAKGPDEALRSLGPLRARCSWRTRAWPVCGLTTGVLPRFLEKTVDLVAIERLAHVVMALLEHRQREGSWPQGLAALGEMPLDPFTNLPFVYETTDRGVRVHAAKTDRRGAAETWANLEEDLLGWAFEE